MEGYALFRGLCALAKNAYAGGCARVMRIVSLGPPLDLDTVCLDQVYLDAVCLIHPHHSEALLIAIELRGVSRVYAYRA